MPTILLCGYVKSDVSDQSISVSSWIAAEKIDKSIEQVVCFLNTDKFDLD